MQHPYDALKGEYERLLAACQILPEQRMTLQVAARRILPLKERYAAVTAKTNVPIVWLMVTNERESDSSLYTYLGNGESVIGPAAMREGKRTHLVPKNQGPFPDWESGAISALHLDHIDQVTDWCWTRALYEDHIWNGFGPEAHGRHTGYLWAGTNIYDGGKYVSDGVWDQNAWDKQLGTVPLMLTLAGLDPSLHLPGSIQADAAKPIPAPAPPPVGHDGGEDGVTWLQESLDKLITAQRLNADPLRVDGSYGRRTRAVVRQFQLEHDLITDGLAGPVTIGELKAALATYTGA